MSNPNHWLRLWHEMPSDPKFRTVSKISKRPISEVLSIYLVFLVDASKNSPRGHKTITNEDVASALDIEVESVDVVESAMQGRLLDKNRLKGWESRQPLREERDGATPASERMKKLRERKKGETAKEGGKQEPENVPAAEGAAPSSADTGDAKKEDPQKDEGRAKKSDSQKDDDDKFMAGRVCIAMRENGIVEVAPSNVKLIALIEAGASIDEFIEATKTAVKNKKPYFNYALKIVQTQREEAKKLDIHNGPMPTQTHDGKPINPVDLRIFGEAAKGFKPPTIAEDGSIL
jgi:hypothetical protein